MKPGDCNFKLTFLAGELREVWPTSSGMARQIAAVLHRIIVDVFTSDH